MSLGLENFYSRYVYRVLRPDEDPNTDLTCKAANSARTIAQHVETGLKFPSRYISTTSSLEKAKQWIEKADENTSRRYRNRRTTIVRIDIRMIKSQYPQIASSAIDLTNHVNREYFLENETQKKFACAHQEVVFCKKIPHEVVTIEYIISRGHVGVLESGNRYSPRGIPDQSYQTQVAQPYRPDNNPFLNNSLIYSTQSVPKLQTLRSNNLVDFPCRDSARSISLHKESVSASNYQMNARSQRSSGDTSGEISSSTIVLSLITGLFIVYLAKKLFT